MPTTTTGRPAPRRGRSVEHRLARILDTPVLARLVPRLAPETLHQLILYRGLDACGELVTSATPAQLTSLVDLDLWRQARPGRGAQFDADRFGEWLEVLMDTGDSVAARTVASLDAHVVIAGFSRYLRVFDPGTFEPTESSDDEPPDRNEMMDSEKSGDVLECEVGGYLVRARRTDAWDAIVTLLLTLETDHQGYFQTVMQGCRRLSNSRPEVDGLDDLLLAPEQHLHDAAVDRERRLSRQGYATPGDARAFLQMARQRHSTPQSSACESTVAPCAVDPIVAAYFRAVAAQHDPSPEVTNPRAAARPSDHDAGELRTSIDAIAELLVEAGVMPGRPRGLLEAAADDPRAPRLQLLRRRMELVLNCDETAYLTRTRELAFLANTLLAGSSVQSRPFTTQEASDAAACICNLGLECWDDASSRGDALLLDHGLVAAFEVGWSVLYRDVSLFVADQLVSTLANLQCYDADIRRGLRVLQRKLARDREAGTPWLARDAAEVLATLDMTAWISVVGLLDECPILPAALTAVLERRTTSISPTAFEFISTRAQIGDIRLFMRTLPGLLSA